MLTTIILGILTSTVAEIITALNKKLQGTLLQGDAAFLIAFGIALPAAVLKEVVTPGFSLAELTNWAQLVPTFTEVWTVSQVYFLFVVQKLNLDVQPGAPASQV